MSCALAHRVKFFVVLLLLVAARPAAAQRPDTWVQLTSAHFTVYSDGGEKTAARVAVQFEQIRDVFLKIGGDLRVDPGQPMVILAAKDEKSFAELVPEVVTMKSSARPSGLFVGRPEGNYIVLRASVSGASPYWPLYHEYTHQITHLNFPLMPLWLFEGYADFFGMSQIRGRRVSLGHVPAGASLFLQQLQFLPLEELFRADQSSPYYNEANKKNVFYAQSWAMVHMLFVSPEYRDGRALDRYLREVSQGTGPVEAARVAFGDLSRLARRLESYVRSQNFHHFEMNSPIEEIERDFSLRTLSETETLEMLGGFHMARGETAPARAMFEQAAAMAPDSPLAQEGLGFLHLHAGDRATALGYLQRAADLNSPSFLTYYHLAELLLDSGGRSREFLARVEGTLQKSTQLNPRFALSYKLLAELYMMRQESRVRALEAARTAVSLDPSNWQTQLTLAAATARLGRFDEARRIAENVAARSSTPNATSGSRSTLLFIASLEQDAQARVDNPRTAAVDATPGAAATAVSSTEGSAPSRVYQRTGSVANIVCDPSSATLLSLRVDDAVVKLRAQDWASVTFLTWLGSESRPIPCSQLEGVTARIHYTPVEGRTYEGEIVSIAPQPKP
jgi:tetratricopeptide (TPR) repeat protein